MQILIYCNQNYWSINAVENDETNIASDFTLPPDTSNSYNQSKASILNLFSCMVVENKKYHLHTYITLLHFLPIIRKIFKGNITN